MELIGPEVIEKKIEVEKVPEDYQAAKTENESLKKQLSSIQSDLRLLKIEHDLLEKILQRPSDWKRIFKLYENKNGPLTRK